MVGAVHHNNYWTINLGITDIWCPIEYSSSLVGWAKLLAFIAASRNTTYFKNIILLNIFDVTPALIKNKVQLPMVDTLYYNYEIIDSYQWHITTGNQKSLIPRHI